MYFRNVGCGRKDGKKATDPYIYIHFDISMQSKGEMTSSVLCAFGSVHSTSALPSETYQKLTKRLSRGELSLDL
uniref:Uncharacterized protein n=1 Tax=Onchocerca volvulus TaxID=6282 RepID=A0A8R1TT78_ONCVO